MLKAKTVQKSKTALKKRDIPVTPASKPQHGAAGRTGTWRTFRPEIDRPSCKKCGNCILYCPEACIDRDLNVDYDYCKGCGICANECPTKSIKMVRE
ncbi:MAG: Pyruvate synthase subunit PorD [Methanocella sp. PtaU1.Bin125]|nr:MAG: Pyruvate synthase subunit PorD [Methanocella sp. PtaU1.Bin125]